MKNKLIATTALALALTGAICIHSAKKANEVSTIGKFHGTITTYDENDNTELYYQFKSNDNTVWWMLTEEEIGCIPNGSAEYVLIYDNNGTTKENKSCDCEPEYECECEIYDDEFIAIREVKGK